MRYLTSLLLIVALPLTRSHAGPSPESLVARMTDAKNSWEERAAAEDKLALLPPRDVLPLLLPHIAKGMPGGGIWNSAGREHDKQAPRQWQVFYAIGRSWDAQVKKLTTGKDADLLHELLKKAPSPFAKTHILGDLASRWSPIAEPTVANLLKDPKEKPGVRTSAALALILHGKENYHELLLAEAAKGSLEDRTRWHDLLVDPRHKRRRGIDPRVITLSFDLIAAESKRTPRYIHGAYFIATRTGHYLGQNFMPNQNDPRYQGEGGLKEAFFEDTVKNAVQWWEQNKDKLKELQKGSKIR